MQIFFGILLVAFGMYSTIKSEQMLEMFGRIPWAEDKLALSGGTRLFYKLLGLLAIFIGLTLIFGLFEGLLQWIFSPLIRVSQ